MTPIRAQFLHQYKDKVVYEKPIKSVHFGYVGGFPCIWFSLEVSDNDPQYIHEATKYCQQYRSTFFTNRIMRLVDSEGNVLLSIPPQIYEVNMYQLPMCMPTIDVYIYTLTTKQYEVLSENFLR